jgi:aminopeptidase C
MNSSKHTSWNSLINKQINNNMKKILCIFAICALGMNAMAQTDTTQLSADSVEGFQFTTIDSIAITPVKDQNRSGTCWSYSTIGFLESELIRMGKGEYDLSEMFVVHHTMLDRAEYVVRMYGTAQFAPGGSAYDVIYCLKNYGLVPQEAMPGIKYGSTPADTLPVHSELDAVAGGVVKAVTNSGLKKLTPVWKQALTAIYDTYLGERPDTFTYKGKQYTPKTFAEELGLNADDYVSITSYTHHPFYSTFALEVPDNWRMDQMYNVPMDTMMLIIDNALANGYTLAWGADVSEMCFTRKGLGVVPEEEKAVDLTGSDAARWLGLSATDKREELTKKPLPEKTITQEMRQAAYDTWENTDDHGMQIFGTAKDQNGKRYYMVKNSWGTKRSEYKGIWYVSEAYMQYKTNDVLVHKNAIPKDILKKLGIK